MSRHTSALMTALMTALFRGVRLACHLAYGTLLAGIYPLFSLPARQRILRRWSAELLAILHIQMEIAGQVSALHKRGTLIVSNHISWLDVFAINTIRPACFIAKSEVRDWPLLGLLCRRARTIFIERDIRRDTLRSSRLIGAMLNEGEYVSLFPEGTSTDGTRLKHFHSSLFQSAIDSGAAILPAAIRYHDGSGKHCGDAAFIDDMNFFQSLQKVLFSPSLHVTLILLPELSCTGKNRRILAAEAHAAIGTALDAQAALPHAVAARDTPSHAPQADTQSAYSLLVDPLFKLRKRHTG